MSEPCIAYETFGYHGTSAECADKIVNGEFIASDGDDHWLGPGAYFFEDGISKASDDAKSWGATAAWDKDARRNTYDQWAVIKAKLTMSKMLDLTTFEGLKFFEYARAKVRGRVRPKMNEPQSGRKFDNSVINFWAHQLKFDGLRAWFYIKLSRDSRRFKVESGIQNSTVICIRDCKSCISLDHPPITAKGLINH